MDVENGRIQRARRLPSARVGVIIHTLLGMTLGAGISIVGWLALAGVLKEVLCTPEDMSVLCATHTRRTALWAATASEFTFLFAISIVGFVAALLRHHRIVIAYAVLVGVNFIVSLVLGITTIVLFVNVYTPRPAKSMGIFIGLIVAYVIVWLSALVAFITAYTFIRSVNADTPAPGHERGQFDASTSTVDLKTPRPFLLGRLKYEREMRERSAESIAFAPRIVISPPRPSLNIPTPPPSPASLCKEEIAENDEIRMASMVDGSDSHFASMVEGESLRFAPNPDSELADDALVFAPIISARLSFARTPLTPPRSPTSPHTPLSASTSAPSVLQSTPTSVTMLIPPSPSLPSLPRSPRSPSFPRSPVSPTGPPALRPRSPIFSAFRGPIIPSRRMPLIARPIAPPRAAAPPPEKPPVAASVGGWPPLRKPANIPMGDRYPVFRGVRAPGPAPAARAPYARLDTPPARDPHVGAPPLQDPRPVAPPTQATPSRRLSYRRSLSPPSSYRAPRPEAASPDDVPEMLASALMPTRRASLDSPSTNQGEERVPAPPARARPPTRNPALTNTSTVDSPPPRSAIADGAQTRAPDPARTSPTGSPERNATFGRGGILQGVPSAAERAAARAQRRSTGDSQSSVQPQSVYSGQRSSASSGQSKSSALGESVYSAQSKSVYSARSKGTRESASSAAGHSGLDRSASERSTSTRGSAFIRDANATLVEEDAQGTFARESTLAEQDGHGRWSTFMREPSVTLVEDSEDDAYGGIEDLAPPRAPALAHTSDSIAREEAWAVKDAKSRPKLAAQRGRSALGAEVKSAKVWNGEAIGGVERSLSAVQRARLDERRMREEKLPSAKEKKADEEKEKERADEAARARRSRPGRGMPPPVSFRPLVPWRPVSM